MMPRAFLRTKKEKKRVFFSPYVFLLLIFDQIFKISKFQKKSQNFFSKKFSKVFVTESEPRVERRPDFFRATHQHIGKLRKKNDTHRRYTHACMCAQKF